MTCRGAFAALLTGVAITFLSPSAGLGLDPNIPDGLDPGQILPQPAVNAGSTLSPSPAFGLNQRSVSNSRQFIVYCPDVRLRMAVTGFVETAKASALQTLGLRDHWKFPIVVNLMRPSTGNSGRPLCQTSLIHTDEGYKVEIDVALREEQFREVHFPQQIVQAVLLEVAYRDHPPADGDTYANPPAWLVEGISERFQSRATESQPNAALFKQLIETGRLPKIREFLSSNLEVMDSTSRMIYAACASSLVEMLVGLPNGPDNLARIVKDLGKADPDPTAALLKNFASLGGSETALEKWWTLGLARNSASERFLGLSLEETNAKLTALLSLSLVTDPKTGTKATFGLEDYSKFMKVPTARAALFGQSNALAGLVPQAHPLLRPVVLEYQRIVSELARGKTHRVDEALREIGNYRVMVVDRMDKIGDYLNWFEATQIPERSGAFDNYLKAASALENAPAPKRDDAISKYIDQVNREFQ